MPTGEGFLRRRFSNDVKNLAALAPPIESLGHRIAQKLGGSV
jgi:hypothetical protein